MTDPVARLNAALEGRYAIERELGEGGMATGQFTVHHLAQSIPKRGAESIGEPAMQNFKRKILFALTLLVFAVGATPVAAQSQLLRSTRSQTYAYKTVGDLQIKADVHRFDDDVVRPVVIWIHGGALIMGNRAQRRAPSVGGGVFGVTEMMLEAGYVVVSIDYRLAPETRLSSIIEDLEDAFAWVRAQGPELFNADASRIAVMGNSAGGYLTLTAGFRTEPRPTVLVSFWGYGDLVGDWYSQPSEYPRHNRRAIAISAEEAHAQVSGPPISDARDRDGNGGIFYNYTRQNGLWPVEVSGWDPHTETERFYPFMPVRNVTGDYPPTMLIHGTDDTDVPYEQSLMMASEFEQHGVAYELVTIPGGEHGLRGGDPQLVTRAFDEAVAWVNRYMR